MGEMVKVDVKRPVQRQCEVCGQMSSNKLCQACALLETLNKGMARIDMADAEKPVPPSQAGMTVQ